MELSSKKWEDLRMRTIEFKLSDSPPGEVLNGILRSTTIGQALIELDNKYIWFLKKDLVLL